MRRLAATFAVSLLLGVPVPAAARPVLVELFTSQGCSSCPEADGMMQELAQRGDVVALTLPVDIWDYLGWTDTFAQHTFTERQQAYALGLPSRSVYTPQIVVGGIGDVVGSRHDDVRAMIAAHLAKEMPGADIRLTRTPSSIIIEIAESPQLKGVEAMVMAARLTASSAVNITGGENSGKTVTYTNVVRELAAIGAWSGDAAKIELPLQGASSEGQDRIAVFVQREGQGPVLGAAIIAVQP